MGVYKLQYIENYTEIGKDEIDTLKRMPRLSDAALQILKSHYIVQLKGLVHSSPRPYAHYIATGVTLQ